MFQRGNPAVFQLARPARTSVNCQGVVEDDKAFLVGMSWNKLGIALDAFVFVIAVDEHQVELDAPGFKLPTARSAMRIPKVFDCAGQVPTPQRRADACCRLPRRPRRSRENRPATGPFRRRPLRFRGSSETAGPA